MQKICEIVKNCNNLQADEEITINKFGKNRDLTLHIHKDCDYDTVDISTVKDDTFVDDTNCVYIADGSLYKELERIYNYRNFETLD